MDESTTRALLNRVVAQAPPPAPVDLDRVVGLAEAYQRRRTQLIVATAAALVLIVTVAVGALAAGLGSEGQHPPAVRPPDNRMAGDCSMPRPAPSGIASPRVAPVQFAAAHSHLRLSGVPTGLTESGTAVRAGELVFYGDDHRGGFLQVMAGAKGHPLQDVRSLAEFKVVPGPTINGHPSKWYHVRDGNYLLRWQWAPDAEAFVNLESIAEPLVVAQRIASSLIVDLATPARLPFTFPAPAGFTLKEFETTTKSGACSAATVAYGGPGPSFVSMNANPLGSGIGKSKTTYQGRPVRITQESGYTTVILAAKDLKVTGTCNYRPNKLIAAAQFKSLCVSTTANVKRLADLQDPIHWPVFAPR